MVCTALGGLLTNANDQGKLTRSHLDITYVKEPISAGAKNASIEDPHYHRDVNRIE